MKIQSFQIPGYPLLEPIQKHIQAQRGDRERILGPVSVTITACLVMPQCESAERIEAAKAGAVLPIEGPDVVAIACAVNAALERSGVIRSVMQVVSVTASKQYCEVPGITITVMEV